jgi:DNA modification methylase
VVSIASNKAEWPADRVERRKVADLLPYAKNARTHSADQVAQLARSIEQFGFTNPVLVDDDGTIIAGHGRVLAAKRLKLDTVPVMVASGWTDAQRRAYVIADNQLALNAGWDEDVLKDELRALGEMGFDLALTGFDDVRLASFLVSGEGLTDPDEVPDAPAVPTTRLGDVWLLGDHRVMCGDSTDAGVVERVMDGRPADLVFTSPPYAQQRTYTKAIADWDAMMQGVFAALPVHETTQVLVNLGLVHRENEWIPYWDGWIEWMRSQGWRRFGWYVWDQGSGMPGDWNGRLAPSHEFIFHFNTEAERARKSRAKKPESIKLNRTTMRARDGAVGTRISNPAAGLQPNRVADSVIRVVRHMARGIEVEHPAVFPVDLVGEVMLAYSDAGDTVFDPFGGSGTSVIAGEKHGRAVRCLDIAPTYVDVSVRRWEAFTGREAILDGTSSTFTEIARQRATSEAA